MTKEEAVKILKNHNKWRRGEETDQTKPKILGEAIDLVVSLLEECHICNQVTDTDNKER